MWETVVESDGKKITYSISINSENKNVYDSFLLDKLKVDQEAIAAELMEKTGDTKSKDVVDAIKHEVCTA